MLREVSSGVLKRSSFVSVFFNIFNLDENIEGEFLNFVALTRLRRRACVEDYRIFIYRNFSMFI